MFCESRGDGVVAVIVSCSTCGKGVEEKHWMVKQSHQNWTDTSNGSFKQKLSNRLGKLKPCCTTVGRSIRIDNRAAATPPSDAPPLAVGDCTAHARTLLHMH